jgi:hypothetical protein
MKFIQITYEPSPHLPENTHCLSIIIKAIGDGFREIADVFFCFVFWESYKTHRSTVWAKQIFLNLKGVENVQ